MPCIWVLGPSGTHPKQAQCSVLRSLDWDSTSESETDGFGRRTGSMAHPQ